MKPIITRSASLIVLCVLTPAQFAGAQSSGGGYSLRKAVIGAGVSSQAAPYRLQATAAQPAAAVSSGGSYRLTGGFHQPALAPLGPLFCSGFEDAACTPGAR